jgi:hypothetical protein
MPSVLIVGAGPAGLVTAKTLKSRPYRPFRVTVYEAADTVGGMWAGGEKCDPRMRTNLSRFTVAFSDFPWLPDSQTGDLPIFPRAHQVGAYLQAYAERFLPAYVIQCRRQVVSADLVEGRWVVDSCCTTTGEKFRDDFDYLVVASGFFGPPDRPDFWKETLSVKKQHSSEFRHVRDLTESPGNIVVFGGGISGCEAAASAAFQLSNGKHQPGDAKRAWADSKVYHIFERPFYCLPRYLPQNPRYQDSEDFNPAPTFLPLDLQLYNVARRGDGPVSASSGRMSPEKAEKAHTFIRSLLGSDQRELGRAELVSYGDFIEYPAFTGISDLYSEFVRSGIIVPFRGRVTGSESYVDKETTIRVSQKGLAAVITEPDMDYLVRQRMKEEEGIVSTSDFCREETTESRTIRARATTQGDTWMTEGSNDASVIDPSVRHIADVVGIIEATGFQPRVDYLSEHVLLALGHDPKSKRIPFLLSHGSIFNKNIPELAFIGFYEGPYWGVMEAQANVLASSWDSESLEISDLYDVKVSRDTRRAIKEKDTSVPQFWMADYVGLMEQLSRMAHVTRNNFAFEDPVGYVYPARYLNQMSGRSGAEQTIREVTEAVYAAEHSARFVAAAAFRGMQGTWNLRRTSAIQKVVYELHLNMVTPPNTFALRLVMRSTSIAWRIFLQPGVARRNFRSNGSFVITSPATP